MAANDAEWEIAGQWWEDYSAAQGADLVSLREILRELTDRWKQSETAFNADPLAVDWRASNPQSSPMRTGQEENWSRWLAQLIRDSDGVFNRLLLSSTYDSVPDSVRCELAFSDEELHDRRVDLLGIFGDHGLTIEVKIDDKHYDKTLQTAYLVEAHYPPWERQTASLDWSHYLLLPQSKLDALRGTFGEHLREDDEDRPRVIARGHAERDVEVLFWSDVAHACRVALLKESEPTDHWMSSAYLFITLIEERILRYYPISEVEQHSTGTLDVKDIEQLQNIEPEEQIDHLRQVREAITNG